jgi:hypothetical protein
MAAPSSYFKWGTVTDTYFGVVADQDLDPTRTPDLVPVQGRVVFTPTLPNGGAAAVHVGAVRRDPARRSPRSTTTPGSSPSTTSSGSA